MIWEFGNVRIWECVDVGIRKLNNEGYGKIEFDIGNDFQFCSGGY